MMLLSGLLLAITSGFITQVSDENIWFTILAKRFGDFRISVVWMILIVLFFHFMLNSTTYGNWVFATGGNETIARKMGINTLRGPRKTRCFSGLPSCQVGEAVIFKGERQLFSHGLSGSFLISRSSSVFCSFLSRPILLSCSFSPPVESRADYAP
jgi:ABC-type uncharacterized transport system permease subunit